MIYLDNAATTGKKPDSVIEAVTDAMKHLSVNAGRGSYELARQAVQIVEDCRSNLLALAGISSGYHVYFSPSATISMNQIILGLELNCYSNIYVTPFEHNAVMRPIHAKCKEAKAKLNVLPFQKEEWVLNENMTETMFLMNKPDYVFVSFVSNTTGYILPVAKIVQMAHRYGAKVVVDCAQALGAIDVNYYDIDADVYVFAGHKTLYGPYGVAGIILKDSFKPNPGLLGGTGSDSLNLDMPEAKAGRFEPGSLNIFAICGLNAALKWIDNVGVSEIQKHESNLINYLVEETISFDRVRLFVPPSESRSSIMAFAVEGYQSHEIGDILEEEFGIAVRTGYQCAPLVHDWMGSREYTGIVRASVSYFSTNNDVVKLVGALKTL